jgi:hypothetical protein
MIKNLTHPNQMRHPGGQPAGESKHSAGYPRIARTALRMRRTVLCHRLGWR